MRSVDELDDGVKVLGEAAAPLSASDGTRLPVAGDCRHGSSSEPFKICGACLRARWAELGCSYATHVRAHRRKYLKAAGVPPRFTTCGLDNYDLRTRDHERALAELMAWAAKIGAPGASGAQQRGLYLHGPVGTGKTHLAVAALLELLAACRRGQFVSVRDLLLECRESFRDGAERRLSEILEDTLASEVLLLDDAGSEKGSQFSTLDVLLGLVDAAYTDGRPALIVTSNLSLEELGKKTTDRISDRLRELCQTVRLSGPSHRRRISGC